MGKFRVKHIPKYNCEAHAQAAAVDAAAAATEETKESPPQDEEEDNPNQEGGHTTTCHIQDLSDSCPDSSVEHDKLVAQCDGTHGIPAAKCYMTYLCENHDQETVNNHKDCIDDVCPL